MFRSRKLLNLARGAPCMLRILDVCNNNPETTVACHSNQQIHGHATSLKSHDNFIVFGCSSCHYELDEGRLARADKVAYFQRGMDRTMLYLWEEGLIDVAG